MKSARLNPTVGVITMTVAVILPDTAFAMHIAEGILEGTSVVVWSLACIPFLYLGLSKIKKESLQNPEHKLFVTLVGAGVFLISCMPIPVPIAGSCSHPCGTGLAAILIGPAPTVVVACIALLLQALFLAHGGLTTLGANLFAMGVAGAFIGYAVYRLARIIGIPMLWAVFLAGVASDWACYAATSFVLATALSQNESFVPLLKTFLLAFTPTQLPLGVLEGVLSMGAFRLIRVRLPNFLKPTNRVEALDV